MFEFLGESAKYTANTGLVTISTANSNLDGTGTLATVLTAASNGTFITSVIIKAQGSPSQGMVRLFIKTGVGAGTKFRLLVEIEVPPYSQTGIWASFSRVVHLNMSLKAADVLMASTENANTFCITAIGYNWTY